MKILPETAAALGRLAESTDVDLVAAVTDASERVAAASLVLWLLTTLAGSALTNIG